ncbi:uncharacterized protein TrAtP1_003169 [Trichoderma atroviride]|uniref:uncharacterized protein n=1 Tax=Hypocrea atroviridis TaxID=63577 RepID=UPI003328934F|nr:hypothetical protein TrAtP1_003169 [Trichoderma atroviride]
MPDRLNRPPLANPMRSPKVRGDRGGLYWACRVVAPLLFSAGFGGNAAYPELSRHFWRSRTSDGASEWMEMRKRIGLCHRENGRAWAAILDEPRFVYCACLGSLRNVDRKAGWLKAQAR